MPLSVRQSTELFHLVFLRALVAKGEDKGLVALKGGCNLRFFFGSVRYSEAIDLDVVVIARETLKNKVDRLLRSPAVTAPLKANGLTIVETSAPKQTETTQRWKVGLRREGDGLSVRTKVEFSRRDAIEGTKFEAADREVLRPYGLTPVLAAHYTTGAAIRQKIHALAARAETQARDVFDLSLLLARSDAAGLALDAAARKWLSEAIDHAMGLSFDEYASTVVAFLDPSHAQIYAERSAWDAMQEDVVSRLEALR
ncbi:MAG TPA: nucleotidyl transferase AbiEii/AbiGii toxin family protein [Polyangiaceae bacterium]|nr:nucleotidyl transferase AbiEii/AbiGii toxin family protein [Polyangiaceae bacterium]